MRRVYVGYNLSLFQMFMRWLFNPNRRIETICSECAFMDEHSSDCKALYSVFKSTQTGEMNFVYENREFVNTRLHCKYYLRNNAIKLSKLMEG